MALLSPAPPRPSSPAPTPTTDFTLLESQKENIRPLATGRSAATLSALFVKESSSAERAVQEGHERFLRDIAEAERRDRDGEEMVEGVQDVLDLHNRYVLFTMQHHPSSASHLLPLLESTTRKFLGDARYSQDIRYLKLWVNYARQVERREEIFAFLESRDIGTRHSTLYEEWATAAEGLKRNKKADEVFRLGIARQAAPLERLNRLYKEFLGRHILSPDGSIPENDPLPTRTPGRSVLSSLTSTISAPRSSISGAVQPSQTPRKSTRNPNGSKMEIFSDSQGVEEESEAPEWTDFGTRDGRRKENVVEAGPWKGEILPQSAARGRIAPRTPKVEVFKDESAGREEAIRSAEDVFSRSKQATSEAELLKSDPLRHYDTSALSATVPSITTTLPPPPTSRKPKVQQPAATTSIANLWQVGGDWECPTGGADMVNAAGKLERRVFDWASVYKGGEEWSFEEVRARERGLLRREWGEMKDWEMGWHAPGSSTPKMEKKKAMPSPTVNTKLADEDVRGMFNQTIGAGHRNSDSESDSDSEASDHDEEEDVVQPLPTPLPGREMMSTSTGFVPPTPTPASGHITQNRMFAPISTAEKLLVFVDENAVPAPAGRGRINVFAETPSKTPLASRTPLANSTIKPKPFAILKDDPIVEEESAPTTSVDIFATTALSEKRPSTSIAFQPLLDEEAEPHSNADYTDEERYEDHYEEVERRPSHGRQLRHQYGYHREFREMTPITERTSEYTQMTARSSMGRRISVMSEADDEVGEGDEAVLLSNPDEVGITGLSIIEETSHTMPEFERLRANEGDRSTGTDDQTSPTSANFSCSGLEPNFQLPEGYTIQHRAEVTRTMVFVDGAEVDRGRESMGSEGGSGAFVTATSGLDDLRIAQIPNPCVPNDEAVVSTLLSKTQPPLSSIPGFFDLRHSSLNQLDKLQKSTKTSQRRGSASSSSRASLAHDDGYILSLGEKKFEVKDKIGEGGFGAVFLAVDVAIRQEMDDADSDDEDEDWLTDRSLVAIKVEKPSCVWEFVILSRIHEKVEESIRNSVIRCQQLYAFSDESYLIIDYCSQGTLLDVVNKAGSIGISPAVSGTTGGVDELVAIFFMVELLKIIEGIHIAGFIHGDLKIDNCLIRLDDISASAGGASSWSTQYSKSGSEGWSHKGLKLIDFGRAIDLQLFEVGEKQRFVADWPVDERDCWEVKEAREWAWESDYFGLAGIGFCLLFGKYIQTEFEVDDEGRRKCKIATPLKRYWQTTLWNELFDILLNPPKDDLPCTGALTELRRKFEGWLEENCQKGGKSLKAFLKKIELGALVRR